MIDVQNVRFTYDGANFALDGVSLHVRKGEFLCILGGNGSGKSTLAKHLNALLIPDEGTVKVHGHRGRRLHVPHPRDGGHGVPKSR